MKSGYSNSGDNEHDDFQQPSDPAIQLSEKIERLNLLQICGEIWPYLETIQPCNKAHKKNFDYVRIFHGQLFFYTEKYINEHSIEDLKKAFEATQDTNFSFMSDFGTLQI